MDGTARGRDQNGALLHAGQRLGIHNSAAFGRQRAMHADDIGLRQQFRQFHLFRAALGHGFGIHIRVISQHAAIEGGLHNGGGA